MYFYVVKDYLWGVIYLNRYYIFDREKVSILGIDLDCLVI